jgi:peptidoglycan-associated lipoprotein
MKMMKLTYLLTFAVAITLAVTGCRNHRPVGVTHIKGTANTGPGYDENINTKPYSGADSQNIATAPIETFEGMTKDTAALAAFTVHFAYDSSAVKRSERANLQSVADALSRDSSAKLLIEGNCDERGTEEYNRALGERRAQALRRELAKLGVNPMRIRTISYGKDKPADSGHDESAWSNNRRGDFVLLHPKSGA